MLGFANIKRNETLQEVAASFPSWGYNHLTKLILIMTKEELKLQYKLKKISTREYFLALGKILASEVPVSKSPVKNDLDILSIFDGKLPL